MGKDEDGGAAEHVRLLAARLVLHVAFRDDDGDNRETGRFTVAVV